MDRINRLQGNGKRNSVRCKLSKKVCSPLGPLCEGDSPRCGEMSHQRQRGPGPKGSARRRWGRELCGCPKYFGLWQGSLPPPLRGTSLAEGGFSTHCKYSISLYRVCRIRARKRCDGLSVPFPRGKPVFPVDKPSPLHYYKYCL